MGRDEFLLINKTVYHTPRPALPDVKKLIQEAKARKRKRAETENAASGRRSRRRRKSSEKKETMPAIQQRSRRSRRKKGDNKKEKNVKKISVQTFTFQSDSEDHQRPSSDIEEDSGNLSEELNPVAYGSQRYWDYRYKKTHRHQKYEWYCEPTDVLNAGLKEHLPKSRAAKVLELGCGNSVLISLLEEKKKYTNLIAADYSREVIALMKKQQTKESKIKFEVQDARQTSYADNTFDFVCSKGLMDAVDCGKQLNSDNFEQCLIVASEIHRILKPKAKWAICTTRSYSKRTEFIEFLEEEFHREFKPVARFKVPSQIDKDNTSLCIILKKEATRF